ncbi:MAG: hypothetical protein EOP59_12725, partial [Sphingomonadales bacterium]
MIAVPLSHPPCGSITIPGIAPSWVWTEKLTAGAPFGPWITTADEIVDPHALGIKAWVGDELRQDSNTRHLVFDLWDQIVHLSHAMTR